MDISNMELGIIHDDLLTRPSLTTSLPCTLTFCSTQACTLVVL